MPGAQSIFCVAWPYDPRPAGAPNALGYSKIVSRPGEAHQVRTDLGTAAQDLGGDERQLGLFDAMPETPKRTDRLNAALDKIGTTCTAASPTSWGRCSTGRTRSARAPPSHPRPPTCWC